MDTHPRPPTKAFYLLGAITAAYSIFSAVLMTDVGQVFAAPRDWIIAYYEGRALFIALNLALLGGLWTLHLRQGIWRRSWMVAASLAVIVCVISANFLNYNLFPTRQQGATFVSLAEADALLDDDEVVFAMEVNGEVRGFPRSHMELPHVAGATIGGEEVAMTFCGLSNLPVAIDSEIGGEPTDLAVMAQTNNNLILIDRNSGDLIQQISMEAEFSENVATIRPNTMMPWRSFRELFPDAEVFVYTGERALDPLFQWFFAKVLETQFDPEEGLTFPTLNLDTGEVNPKEQVWGYDDGSSQIAITREFAAAHPIHRFNLDGRPLVFVYDVQYDVGALFSAERDGALVDFEEVDFRGQTESVRLIQLPTHNGVFWMVWTHFYPDSLLLR